MPLKITTDEALRRFAANPQAAAQFDAATAEEYPQAKNRREAVQWILNAMNAKVDALNASSAALRAKLASARATLAARGETSVANNRLKQATKPAAPAPRAIAPAAKAEPQFPLLARLETLKGSQAVAFIKANQTAISIEQRIQREAEFRARK